jgi:hypothetical protein
MLVLHYHWNHHILVNYHSDPGWYHIISCWVCEGGRRLVSETIHWLDDLHYDQPIRIATLTGKSIYLKVAMTPQSPPQCTATR